MELSLGVGLTLLEGLGAGVESTDGLLDWTSRRRVAMRSTMDCRPVVVRSEILGEELSAIGLDDVPGPIRLAMSFVAFELTPLRGDGADLSMEELLF